MHHTRLGPAHAVKGGELLVLESLGDLDHAIRAEVEDHDRVACRGGRGGGGGGGWAERGGWVGGEEGWVGGREGWVGWGWVGGSGGWVVSF